MEVGGIVVASPVLIVDVAPGVVTRDTGGPDIGWSFRLTLFWSAKAQIEIKQRNKIKSAIKK